MLHYSLNCLPTLILMMFIKSSYDCLDLDMWVLILKLQRACISYLRITQKQL